MTTATTGAVVSGQITHFSTGFVANGVNYSDPPDLSCVRTDSLAQRNVSPSGLTLFFSAEDCQGRPITDLNAASLAISEDGVNISTEAMSTLLPVNGLVVYASLVIDMSSSTNGILPQVIAGAREYVQQLQVNAGLRVYIGLYLFDGSATTTEWQAPTLDSMRLMTRLDELSTF